MLDNFDFTSISAIKEAGFQGFATIAHLQTSRCADVSNTRGVYLVLRNTSIPPTFLLQSPGGHFKAKDPTVERPMLQREWVDGPIVIYIGKAGGTAGNATLRRRLGQYMRFGLGKPVGHWGGRLIWQLADHRNLLVCWKSTLDTNPASFESQLIQSFYLTYRRLPFANLRN
jgi:hypothetical protein